MSKLINPRLDVFSYHLRGGLGDSQERIQANWQNFWDNFPDNFPSELKVPLEDEQYLDSTQYGKLLKVLKNHQTSPRHLYLLPKDINSDGIVEGFYCPVRLHDTYGLGFACGVDSHPNSLDVKYFQYFQTLAPANLIRQANSDKKFKYNYMGTTWMLSGCLPPNSKETPEEIAKAAYKKLNFNQEWSESEKEEEFMGASVFEIGRSPERWHSLDENYHVLIFIYRDLDTMEEASKKFYENWMQLFSYRHKIIWSYWQALELIPWLKDNFFSLEKVRRNSAIRSMIVAKNHEADTEIQAFNLKQLQIALHDNSVSLYEYVRKLSLLKIHVQTIETNIENYNKCLDKIKKDAIELNANTTSDDLLSYFSSTVAHYYKTIIDKEYTSLSPSVGVLQNLTETLRGYVQIQQAEIDRNLEKQNRNLEKQNGDFQNNLAVVGLGIGAASVAASATPQFIEEITHHRVIKFSKQPHPTLEAILNIFVTISFSIIVGILCSLITRWILSSSSRQSNYTGSPSSKE